MRFNTLLLGLACLVLTGGCGKFFSNDSEYDADGNPTNVAAGGYFKVDWLERSFSSRGLTRCQFNAAQNGLGVLEVSFQDSETDSELRLVLSGLNPQNNQHQILGAGRTSGGSILLKSGGDQRLNSYKNQSSNGRGNSTQCLIRNRVQGRAVEIAFECSNLFNDYGQPKNASGEVRCMSEQYTWED
ncbi:hypothetical protein EBT16_08690 [bacterium]|nr:hypothetical protein [bacterium]